MKFYQKTLSDKTITALEWGLIIVTASIPLFFSYPYRINLFLAWEGAFRISNGEIPYRDFGSPVGYGFWLLPALFFKIFGPYVYTLIVVQVFINILSGLTFRALLKLFHVPAAVRWMGILVFCLSYSMFNFWPWYNHFVFVLEIIGLFFLCSEILKPVAERKVLRLVVAAFFIALSFMTKQDTGGISFMICLVLVAFDAWFEKHFKTLLVFAGAYAISMAILIVPFLPYDFTYWFNMGQFPHNARVDKFDIVNEFFGASNFIKFYLLLILVAILYKAKQVTTVGPEEKRFILFTLVVLAILGQAAIIQITSYTPIDGNIYFHSFAFVFLLYFFAQGIDLSRVVSFAAMGLLVCMWWSGTFWTRFLKERVEKVLVSGKKNTDQVISRRTYLLNQDSTTKSNRSRWVVPGIASFKRVKVPESTAEGIEKILQLPESKKKDMKMLNMSELTPLAYDMGYALEKDPYHPLWFHKGVSFFDREVKRFCDKVSQQEYDIVLFEDIPNVNQFYPYEVRDCIREHYTFKFKFLAPRVPESCYIEVYTKE